MVKSVWVPSMATTAVAASDTAAASRTRRRRGRVDNGNNNGNDDGGNGNANESVARENYSNVEEEEPDDNSKAAAKITLPATASFDFNHVFAELQKYKEENNGSLSIPMSHPAMSQIIDSLSVSSSHGHGNNSMSIESLSKQRWEDQFVLLKKYKQSHQGGDNVNANVNYTVPIDHPTLGNWVRIQKEQYTMYEEAGNMFSTLTKKRFGKLKSIGFGDNNNDNDDGETNDKLLSKEYPIERKYDDSSRNVEDEQAKIEETAISQVDEEHDYGKDTTPTDRNRKKTVMKMQPKKEISEEGSDEQSIVPVEYKDDATTAKTTVSTAKSNRKRKNNDNDNITTISQVDEENDYGEDSTPTDRNRKKTVMQMQPKEEISEEGRDEQRMVPVKYNDDATPAKTTVPTAKNNRKRENNDNVNIATKIKGKCDICEKNDGFWGHNLQQCKVCHVLVHELCYGMVETTTKDPNFTCHACNAVGTSVEVNVPSKIGGCGKKMGRKRELVKQRHRPKECLLCSHDKGFHAMHPLLDTHGSEGRQLVVDRTVWKDGTARKEKRLAWVHTLCASVIGSNPGTESSVYGCDKYGNYYGYDDEGDSDDEEEFAGDDDGVNTKDEDDDKAAKKMTNQSDKEEESGGDEECAERMDIRSFAISHEGAWATNIRDHRELKCFVCGKKDKKWRIPVQCTAGDDGELDRWKSRHPTSTACYVAMHVGCARWGCVEPEGSHLETIDGKKCRMCYFTPGRDAAEEEEDGDDTASKDSHDREKVKTIVGCYCTMHARDIVLNNPNRKKRPRAAMVKTEHSRKKSAPNPVKEEQPRKKFATESLESRESRTAYPQKKLSEHAEQSLKKSMNNIRQKRGSIKKVSSKRKPGTQPEGRFGAAAGPNKKHRVEFTEENMAQFPSRGRSANALGHGQPIGLSNPGAASANNLGDSRAPAGILKRNPSVVKNHSLAPAGILRRKHPAVSDGLGKASVGRRPGTFPDVSTDGDSFKRIKSED